MSLDERITSALDASSAAVPSTYRRATFAVAMAIADYILANPEQALGNTGRWSVDDDALFKRVAATNSFDGLRISAIVWDRALAVAMAVVGSPR
jgi:hypothetical protein